MSTLRNHKPLTNEQIDKLTNEGGVPAGANSIIEKAGLLLACLPETGRVTPDELANIARVDATKDSSWLRARRALVNAGLVNKTGHGAKTTYRLAPDANDKEELNMEQYTGAFYSGNRARTTLKQVMKQLDTMQKSGEAVEVTVAPNDQEGLATWARELYTTLEGRNHTLSAEPLLSRAPYWSESWIYMVVTPDAYETLRNADEDTRKLLDLVSVMGRMVGMVWLIVRETAHPQTVQVANHYDDTGNRLVADTQ